MSVVLPLMVVNVNVFQALSALISTTEKMLKIKHSSMSHLFKMRMFYNNIQIPSNKQNWNTVKEN